jgi:hypothetical protein
MMTPKRNATLLWAREFCKSKHNVEEFDNIVNKFLERKRGNIPDEQYRAILNATVKQGKTVQTVSKELNISLARVQLIVTKTMHYFSTQGYPT